MCTLPARTRLGLYASLMHPESQSMDQSSRQRMRLKQRLSTIRPAFQTSLRASRSRSWLRAVTNLIPPSCLYLLRTCRGTSTSTLKRVIQRPINPQKHVNGGGCKSSSPGSACTSGEDDSSSCACGPEHEQHRHSSPIFPPHIHINQKKPIWSFVAHRANTPPFILFILVLVATLPFSLVFFSLLSMPKQSGYSDPSPL